VCAEGAGAGAAEQAASFAAARGEWARELAVDEQVRDS
jgi:hypothetical protein